MANPTNPRLTSSRPSQNPNTSPVPQPAQNGANFLATLAALKANVESLSGQRGNASDRAVTFNDLISYGVLEPHAVASPRGIFTGGGGGVTIGGGGSGGGGATISATPPLSPTVGQLWWDSVGGQLFTWYTDPNSSQWVIANSITGGTITGDIIMDCGDF